MKGGINKVILVGNLGADAEVRYLPNGSAVASLSLATSDSWKDKTTGQQQERTEWHKVVMFGKPAELAGQFAKKGRKMYVEGALRTRKWQDQNGQDRWTTEIVASDFLMLDPQGNRESGQGDEYEQYAEAPAPQAAPARAARPAAAQGRRAPAAGEAVAAGGGGPDFSDDIPFAQVGREGAQ